MRIIGVDPGLNITGYGLVDLSKSGGARVLEAGTIEPDRKAAFEARLFKIHLHLTAILKEHRPDMLVLEKLYAHEKHPATAAILGHVRGVICLCAAEQKVQLVEQSVKRVRKALMGNGNATKAQAQEFVKRVLNITTPGFKLDASDALCLALGQAHMLRYNLT